MSSAQGSLSLGPDDKRESTISTEFGNRVMCQDKGAKCLRGGALERCEKRDGPDAVTNGEVLSPIGLTPKEVLSCTVQEVVLATGIC